MIRLLVVVFLFAIPTMGVGQSSVKDKDGKLIFPKYRVGYSPSALATWMPAVQISADAAMKDNINFTVEYGYIFYGRPFDVNQENNLINTSGTQLRLGPEFSVSRTSSDIVSIGLYFVSQQYTYTDDRWIDLRPLDYSEYTRVDIKESIKGFALGFQWGLPLSKRIFVDLGIGIGGGTLTTNDPVRGERQIPRAIGYFNTNASYAF